MGYCGDDGTGHVALHRSLGMEALSAVWAWYRSLVSADSENTYDKNTSKMKAGSKYTVMVN